VLILYVGWCCVDRACEFGTCCDRIYLGQQRDLTGGFHETLKSDISIAISVYLNMLDWILVTRGC